MSQLIRSISPYYFERARDTLELAKGDYPDGSVIKIHEDERFVYYIYKDTSLYDSYNRGWIETGFLKSDYAIQRYKVSSLQVSL